MGKTIIKHNNLFLSINNNFTREDIGVINPGSTYTITSSGHYFLSLDAGSSGGTTNIYAKVNDYVLFGHMTGVAYSGTGHFFYFEKGTIISITGGTSTSSGHLYKIN